MENFGRDALVAVRKVCKDLSISHPGAIMWALPAEVGKLASRKSSTHVPLDTPFARTVDNYIPKPRPTREELGMTRK